MARRRMVGSLAAALLLATALPGVAAGASAGPFVYVTNAESGTVSAFAVGGGGGLTFLGATEPETPIQDLRGIAVGRDGRTVYATDTEFDHVVAYRVGPTGALTPLQSVPSDGSSPFGIVVSPDGRSVYVADIDSDKVSRYAVLPNGKLGDAESVPTGAAHPRGVAVSPDGRFLYVSHGTPMPPPAEPGFLTTMDIRPDGTLSPGDNQIRIGFSGAMIAIPPDGRFLYVGAQASDEVYGFRIGPDGGLTAVPGPTPTAKSAGVPEGIAVTPDGHHVYTADEDDALGNVRGFTAAADGSLTDVRRKPFDRHHSHVGIAVTPDGRYVYASNGTDNRVTGFAIDGAGILHRVADSPSYGVGSAFQSLAISPGLG